MRDARSPPGPKQESTDGIGGESAGKQVVKVSLGEIRHYIRSIVVSGAGSSKALLDQEDNPSGAVVQDGSSKQLAKTKQQLPRKRRSPDSEREVGDCSGPACTTEMAEIERPLNFQPALVRSISEEKWWDLQVMEQIPWASVTLRRVFQTGYDRREQLGVLTALPPGLRQTIAELCRATEIIMEYKRQEVRELMERSANSSGISVGVCDEQAWLIDENLLRNEAVAEQQDVAVLYNRFDPDSQSRITGFGTQGMHAMYGMHPEEIQSRLAQGEVPIPVNQFELLCSILDEILHPNLSGDQAGDQIYRVFLRRGNEPYQWRFMRFRKHSSFDAYGRPVCHTLSGTFIESESVEKVLQNAPTLCRPLQYELGDRRGV
jgi:hypothetical protein